MGAVDINISSLLYLIILVIPILILNGMIGLNINKKTIYSIIRMVIQLFLVGLFLQYLFDLNNPFINIAYIIFMIVVASISSIKSCNFKVRKYIFEIVIAFLIPTIITIFYFNFFVLKINNIFEAQYLIPVAGMLLGNSLSGIVISLNNFYKGLKENEKVYFMSLSITASRYEAIKPFYKQAILSSMNPLIASLETIGLVSLPGMMTGQILGGTIPIIAIKYQIAIMIAIFISRYFATLLALLLTSFKAFDDYDTLTI